jgi:ubiquinone/menaquinone biosynthesis C-methylase UbiE
MEQFYQENKKYYERNAGNYENSSWYFFNKYKHNSVNKEIQKCVQAINSKKIKVLEIGPGTGYLISKLIKQPGISYDYCGIEHSEEMTAILLSRYKDKFPIKIYNNSVNADFVQKELKDMKFDLIIGSSILHHLPDYKELIGIFAGLLNENGVMYFVREPIHKNECQPSGFIKNGFASIYGGINNFFMRPRIKQMFWPEKTKQENPTKIGIHMFIEGVSVKPFYELTEKGFHPLFHRKYNRRASSFYSYVENKWLRFLRKDIFGNTLFAIAIIKSKK